MSVKVTDPSTSSTHSEDTMRCYFRILNQEEFKSTREDKRKERESANPLTHDWKITLLLSSNCLLLLFVKISNWICIIFNESSSNCFRITLSSIPRYPHSSKWVSGGAEENCKAKDFLSRVPWNSRSPASPPDNTSNNNKWLPVDVPQRERVRATWASVPSWLRPENVIPCQSIVPYRAWWSWNTEHSANQSSQGSHSVTVTSSPAEDTYSTPSSSVAPVGQRFQGDPQEEKQQLKFIFIGWLRVFVLPLLLLLVR